MKCALFSTHIATQPYINQYDYSKISFENKKRYCQQFDIDFIYNDVVNQKYCITDGKHDVWNGISQTYSFYYGYQKFKISQILKENKYDYLLYLDSDVLLTKNMPHFVQQFPIQNKSFYAIRDFSHHITQKKVIQNTILLFCNKHPKIRQVLWWSINNKQLNQLYPTIIGGDQQIYTNKVNIYQKFLQYKTFVYDSIQKAKNTKFQSILDGHLMWIMMLEKLYDKQIKLEDIIIQQIYDPKNARQILYTQSCNKTIARNKYKIIQFSGLGSYTDAWKYRPISMLRQYKHYRDFYW